jgi:hypothetical protein
MYALIAIIGGIIAIIAITIDILEDRSPAQFHRLSILLTRPYMWLSDKKASTLLDASIRGSSVVFKYLLPRRHLSSVALRLFLYSLIFVALYAPFKLYDAYRLRFYASASDFINTPPEARLVMARRLCTLEHAAAVIQSAIRQPLINTPPPDFSMLPLGNRQSIEFPRLSQPGVFGLYFTELLNGRMITADLDILLPLEEPGSIREAFREKALRTNKINGPNSLLAIQSPPSDASRLAAYRIFKHCGEEHPIELPDADIARAEDMQLPFERSIAEYELAIAFTSDFLHDLMTSKDFNSFMERLQRDLFLIASTANFPAAILLSISLIVSVYVTNRILLAALRRNRLRAKLLLLALDVVLIPIYSVPAAFVFGASQQLSNLQNIMISALPSQAFSDEAGYRRDLQGIVSTADSYKVKICLLVDKTSPAFPVCSWYGKYKEALDAVLVNSAPLWEVPESSWVGYFIPLLNQKPIRSTVAIASLYHARDAGLFEIGRGISYIGFYATAVGPSALNVILFVLILIALLVYALLRRPALLYMEYITKTQDKFRRRLVLSLALVSAIVTLSTRLW